MSRDDGKSERRLELRGLTVELPGGRRLFNNVDLDVGEGEVVVVLGQSGAGKSTLGDVLFDLLADRAPDARVEARAIIADESRMALILQRGSLFDHLGVFENIRFAARRTRGREFSTEEVGEILAEVGLETHDRSVAGLSGGEERRVTVARGIATDPTFIFFDEPTAGLDVSNVIRIGTLIRRVCKGHGAGAIVVTHDPLLAALVGDRLLYLDRRDGSLDELVSDWPGPGDVDDGEGLSARRSTIEAALLDVSGPPPPLEGGYRESRLRRAFRTLLLPGRLIADLGAIVWSFPRSLKHIRDLTQLTWRALHLTGYSGLLFYALVAAIFSTTFLSIAFAAADLVSPETVLVNLKGDFILALTAPLAGFFFAARSGSALTAWLGGMSLRRQTDALRSLGVSVDEYLRTPVFIGTFLGFLLTALVFGAAMYLAGTVTAISFDIPDAAATLRRTTGLFERQFLQKIVLYGALVGLIGTHMGLGAKRNSEDVARGITRSIIFCTLSIVLCELLFAVDLHA
jgi:ABC-type multidrug transport system ATPase subunit/ABC-type transporter Mla maintaining outer membrane lipid asymmetry permease subunit MlaE